MRRRISAKYIASRDSRLNVDGVIGAPTAMGTCGRGTPTTGSPTWEPLSWRRVARLAQRRWELCVRQEGGRGHCTAHPMPLRRDHAFRESASRISQQIACLFKLMRRRRQGAALPLTALLRALPVCLEYDKEDDGKQARHVPCGLGRHAGWRLSVGARGQLRGHLPAHVDGLGARVGRPPPVPPR